VTECSGSQHACPKRVRSTLHFLIGTVTTLLTEAAAPKAAQSLRIDANQQTLQAEGGPRAIDELVALYRLKELAGENQGRKAFSTRTAYECYLKA
jgi:hypothetical protein